MRNTGLFKNNTRWLCQVPFNLHMGYVKTIQSRLENNTFCHVTKRANAESIRQQGLQTKYGGSEQGAATLLDDNFNELKKACKNTIHLGRDDDCSENMSKPSTYYQNFYTNMYVKFITLTVILNQKQIATLKADQFDDQPGRYVSEENIPPTSIFFTELKNILRAPNTISADGPISEEALAAIFPDDDELLFTYDEKIEYLRAAIHDNKEPIYNTLNF